MIISIYLVIQIENGVPLSYLLLLILVLLINITNKDLENFIFSNTFSTTSGGISGPYLIPYTSKLITIVKNKYPDSEIIAGGGIRSMDTINIYQHLGASHFSISTLLFNPLLFATFYYQFYRDLKKQ